MLFKDLEVGKYFVFNTPGIVDVMHVFRKITDVQFASLHEGGGLESTIAPTPSELEPDQEVSQLWI